MLPAVKKPEFKANLANLKRLARTPPQVLLFEGGTEQDRLDMALYWGLMFNCPASREHDASGSPVFAPCLDCLICNQFVANENLDLLLFDGRISNRQDEDSPGPVRALNMDNMRRLKSLLAGNPHGDGRRIVIIQGMSAVREEALNSLLKTLEEPCSHTLFILLTPQRQQILPTLVSRSFCMTLPWPDCGYTDETISPWAASLAAFLGGDGAFLDRMAAKNAMTPILASGIIMACQRSLVRALGQTGLSVPTPLDSFFKSLCDKPAATALITRWINEAQEMISGTVNPVHVMEAFATRLFGLLQKS